MGLVIPSIDLLEGKVVRLYKGNYNQRTVYSEKPLEIAKNFKEMGAKILHIVDLDGARSGYIKNNFKIIEQISKIIPIEIGGGIRRADIVDKYIPFSERIILGTIAVEKPEFVTRMIDKYGIDRIAVSVDVKDKEIVTHGWVKEEKINYLDFIDNLSCEIVIVTDVSKDGTLTSPNWELYKKIKNKKIIVSGGVSKDEDLKNPYYATIVGKAYYEGKINLEKCLRKE